MTDILPSLYIYIYVHAHTTGKINIYKIKLSLDSERNSDNSNISKMNIKIYNDFFYKKKSEECFDLMFERKKTL